MCVPIQKWKILIIVKPWSWSFYGSWSLHRKPMVLTNPYTYWRSQLNLMKRRWAFKSTCNSRNGRKWFKDTVKFNLASLTALLLTTITCIWNKVYRLQLLHESTWDALLGPQNLPSWLVSLNQSYPSSHNPEEYG